MTGFSKPGIVTAHQYGYPEQGKFLNYNIKRIGWI